MTRNPSLRRRLDTCTRSTSMPINEADRHRDPTPTSPRSPRATTRPATRLVAQNERGPAVDPLRRPTAGAAGCPPLRRSGPGTWPS